MSFDTAGRTMMGLTSADMVALVAELPNPPLAFGANCGVGASDLLRTVLGFTAAAPALPVIAKGNAGIPKFVEGHIHYDGTPELMADYARARPRLRRADHRRLLRHHAGAPRRDARGAGDARRRGRCPTSRPSPPGSAASPRPPTGSATPAAASGGAGG